MPLGFVEGQLKIIQLKEVDLAGSAGLRPSKPIAENYAEYPLIILGEGGKKEVARLTAGRREISHCPTTGRLHPRSVGPRTWSRSGQATAAHSCFESDRPGRYEIDTGIR
jgi:hypothetical protein